MNVLFAGSCGGATFGWFADQKVQAHHSGLPTYPDGEESTGCGTSAMVPSKERTQNLISRTYNNMEPYFSRVVRRKFSLT